MIDQTQVQLKMILQLMVQETSTHHGFCSLNLLKFRDRKNSKDIIHNFSWKNSDSFPENLIKNGCGAKFKVTFVEQILSYKSSNLL